MADLDTARIAVAKEKIRERIIGMLTDWPDITRTMISSHTAPYGSDYGVSWTAVLDEMIRNGEVVRYKGARPSGREGEYYRLAQHDRSPELAPA